MRHDTASSESSSPTREPTAFPPPGCVDRKGAEAFFDVAPPTLRDWVEQGKVPKGRLVARRGRPASLVWEIAALERAKAAMAEAAAAELVGFVGQAEAARMLGVGVPGFLKWVREGRLGYAGVHVGIRGGGKRRVYAVDKLLEAHAAMRQRHAERTAMPEGYVDYAGAAKLLGLQKKSMWPWVNAGIVSCGVWSTGPSGRRIKIYPVAELERIPAEMEQRQVLPEGVVDIEGACAMFEVSVGAWHLWQGQGKLPTGRWWVDGTHGRRRVYDVSELRETMERLRGANAVWREGGRDGKYHVPEGRVSVSEAAAMLGMPVQTIRRWDREGIIQSGRLQTTGAGGDGARLQTYASAEIEQLVAEHGRYAPPYPDPDRPGCLRLPLWGRGIERREAIIDAEDLAIVAGRRWYASAFDEGDRVQHVGTSSVAGDILLHHAISGVTRARDQHVGHRNGDPLDCRRANLVIRTLTQTRAAARKQATFNGRPCTSRFKGVCWVEKDGRWLAQIKIHRQKRRLGYFRDEIAAAEAYDEAARELFGEHARPNFPDGVDAWLSDEAERSREDGDASRPPAIAA